MSQFSGDDARALVFRALGTEPRAEREYQLAQNKIYLFERMGGFLGFSYELTEEGPFSAVLDAYLREKEDFLRTAEIPRIELTEESRQHADAIQAFMESMPPSLSEDAWYALLASLVHLLRAGGQDRIYERLMMLGPGYTRQEYCRAAGTLRAAGLPAPVATQRTV